MAPLAVYRGESGGSSRNSNQSALPAWLESLRASDRPSVEPKSFSVEDMREEGMVPSWMQPNRPQDERNSNLQQSMRPAAASAPNTDESYAQERNISANSLIDANALPAWMQPEKPQAPPQNISASSLVQPEFMPDWMKTMQPSSSTPTAPQPKTPSQQPAQGFSAQQLIDPQSLPSWMQQQGGQPVMPPNSQGTPGQSGFAASSLLDVNALPSWMREGEQRNQDQRGTQQQTPQTFQNGYDQQRPSYPSGNNGTVQSQGGTLSMGSLIDVNALPEWLRASTDTPQSQSGQNDANRYSGPNTSLNYTFPPRADNVRVPNRPRNEAGTHEDSEVAANVFSSMLGVASNAPQYPPQQPQLQPQQGSYPVYPGGQAMSNNALPPQGIPSQSLQNPQAYNPQGYNPQGMQSPQGYNPQGYAMNSAGQQNYGYPMQPGQGNYPGLQQNQNMPQQSAKPAKKGGLFEAIRNFFFRS